MGRIAHNLNLAISTYRKFTLKEKIYLVAGCGKQLPYPAAAKDLYYSQHFQACRGYVEEKESRWYILSPLHQVLNPSKNYFVFKKYQSANTLITTVVTHIRKVNIYSNSANTNI